MPGAAESCTNLKQQQKKIALEALKGDLGIEERADIQQILSALRAEGNDPDDMASAPPQPSRHCLCTFAKSFVDRGKENSAAQSGRAFPLRRCMVEKSPAAFGKTLSSD